MNLMRRFYWLFHYTQMQMVYPLLYITIVVSGLKLICFFRVYDDWFNLRDSYIFLVYTAIILLVFVHETTKMAYLSCQVDQIIHLFNIVYTCLSLLHRQGLLLFSHLPWRRQWTLGNCKLMLVPLMMMTVMKTMLIQKRVKLVMMRFVKLWHSYYFLNILVIALVLL